MTRDEAAAVVIDTVMVAEAGVADVGDGKGVTRYGQTDDWLKEFGFETPRSPAQARANYATWVVRTRLIGVCDYPDALALTVIDLAVNSDHRQAIRMLQRVLRVPVDGLLGPETQAAVDQCDRLAVGRQLIADRMRFLAEVMRRKPEKRQFAPAWFDRNAVLVEAL